MLTTDEFIAHLEQLDDPDERHRLLQRESARLTDETVQQMKARANDLLGSDINRGVALADNIIYASQVSGKPLHRALGLMVQANALRRQGQLQQAIALYDQARDTALEAGSEIEAARSQVGKIGALSALSEYRLALEVAEQTAPVLLKHQQHVSAATTFMNAGICHAQLIEHAQALLQYDKARAILEQLDTVNARKQLAVVLFNLSLSQRDMGQYYKALETVTSCIKLAEEYNWPVEKAAYQQGAATCYYSIGDYNRALRLLHEAREILEKNQHHKSLIECERFISECSLQLGLNEEVLESTQKLIQLLGERNMLATFDNALTHRTRGVALLLLNELEAATEVMLKAQVIVEQFGSSQLKQDFDIILAEIYLLQTQTDRAEALLRPLLLSLDSNRLVPRVQLLLARIELSRSNVVEARKLVNGAITNFEQQGVQSGLYESYFQLAEISEQQNELSAALAHTEQSLEQLENLRGRIATETRSVFLRSKEVIYETGVSLALATDQTMKALELAERVKSRSLVELLGHGLDVRIRVKDETDRPLVEELEQLRLKRNEISSRLAYWSPGTPSLTAEERTELTGQLRQCEKRQSQLTDRLQVRNAAYAEDITLTPAPRSFDLSLLAPHEVLVEYYVTRGELLAFVATGQGVQVVRHLMTVAQLNRQLAFFRLNLAGTVKNLSDAATTNPSVFATRLNGLIANSQALLQKLYASLVGPLSEMIAGFTHLILVPHGSLHYLPFHALYNAASGHYLLEDFEEVSYLPSASLLRFSRERAARAKGEGALVMGFSNNGALPCTLEEARQVAQTLGATVHLETEASLPRFRQEATGKKIIHLATHGSFREDAPLFSSLLLAEGELTGHELFNMELQASLVTLSACDSGLGAIGGGDELLGLSRACLYAGAASLALSLWRVDDRAGSIFMQEFYRQLLNGLGKAAAMRQAQLILLQNSQYRHPFYWAPFILIGDNGTL